MAYLSTSRILKLVLLTAIIWFIVVIVMYANRASYSEFPYKLRADGSWDSNEEANVPIHPQARHKELPIRKEPPHIGKEKVENEDEKHVEFLEKEDTPKPPLPEIDQKPEKEIEQIPVMPDAPEDKVYGEMGEAVVLPANLTSEIQALVDKGWKDNAFNQYVSDLISVHRSLPDTRDPWCKVPGRYLEDLPATDVIICFHNEAWSVLLRTVHSVLDRSPPHLIGEIVLVDDFSDMRKYTYFSKKKSMNLDFKPF